MCLKAQICEYQGGITQLSHNSREGHCGVQQHLHTVPEWHTTMLNFNCGWIYCILQGHRVQMFCSASRTFTFLYSPVHVYKYAHVQPLKLQPYNCERTLEWQQPQSENLQKLLKLVNFSAFLLYFSLCFIRPSCPHDSHHLYHTPPSFSLPICLHISLLLPPPFIILPCSTTKPLFQCQLPFYLQKKNDHFAL